MNKISIRRADRVKNTKSGGISDCPRKVKGKLETDEQVAQRLVCAMAKIDACTFTETRTVDDFTQKVRVVKGGNKRPGQKYISNVVGEFVVEIKPL